MFSIVDEADFSRSMIDNHSGIALDKDYAVLDFADFVCEIISGFDICNTLVTVDQFLIHSGACYIRLDDWDGLWKQADFEMGGLLIKKRESLVYDDFVLIHLATGSSLRARLTMGALYINNVCLVAYGTRLGSFGLRVIRLFNLYKDVYYVTFMITVQIGTNEIIEVWYDMRENELLHLKCDRNVLTLTEDVTKWSSRRKWFLGLLARCVMLRKVPILLTVK